MDRESRVLQDGIEIASIRRRRIEAHKRIGCDQHEQQKAETDYAQHAEHASRKAMGQPGYANSHRHRPTAQQEDPQQERAFVGAPHRGDAVEERERGVRVLCDVQDREIVGHERSNQTAHGGGEHHELTGHCRCDRSGPAITSQRGACDTEEALQGRQEHGEDQRKMT